MKSGSSLFTIMAFILVLNVVGCAYNTKLEENIEKTLPLVSGGKLDLSNTNGSIDIEAWDKDEVKIMATKTVRAGNKRDAERYMEHLKVKIEESPNYIRIETEYPQRHGNTTFWDLFSGKGNVNGSVSYVLYVPKKLRLEVLTTNGSVDILGVSGDIYAKSTNGRIKMMDVAGNVSGKTTNGAIEAELNDFNKNEELILKTTNGRIKVALPRGINASLYAKTTNGGISTDFPVTYEGKHSSKIIDGIIGDGGGRIELKTTNGGITIREY